MSFKLKINNKFCRLSAEDSTLKCGCDDQDFTFNNFRLQKAVTHLKINDKELYANLDNTNGKITFGEKNDKRAKISTDKCSIGTDGSVYCPSDGNASGREIITMIEKIKVIKSSPDTNWENYCVESNALSTTTVAGNESNKAIITEINRRVLPTINLISSKENNTIKSNPIKLRITPKTV